MTIVGPRIVRIDPPPKLAPAFMPFYATPHAKNRFRERFGKHLEGDALLEVSKQLAATTCKRGKRRCLVSVGRTLVPFVVDRRRRIIVTVLPSRAARETLKPQER